MAWSTSAFARGTSASLHVSDSARSQARGKVRIYVNGVYQATVGTYPSSASYRAVVWQKTWSSSATRTIKLVVSGTSGRPRVDLDAFVVLR